MSHQDIRTRDAGSLQKFLQVLYVPFARTWPWPNITAFETGAIVPHHPCKLSDRWNDPVPTSHGLAQASIHDHCRDPMPCTFKAQPVAPNINHVARHYQPGASQLTGTRLQSLFWP